MLEVNLKRIQAEGITPTIQPVQVQTARQDQLMHALLQTRAYPGEGNNLAIALVEKSLHSKFFKLRCEHRDQ
jgi:hypothetical protein